MVNISSSFSLDPGLPPTHNANIFKADKSLREPLVRSIVSKNNSKPHSIVLYSEVKRIKDIKKGILY